MLITAAHQIGEAATASGRGYNASAQGAQASQALFDVDGGEVAEYERAGKFLLGVVILAGEDNHRQGGGYALVAAARIAHDGYHRSGHTGVAGVGGGAQDVTEDSVAEDTLAHGAREGLSELMPVIALQGLFGGGFVEAARLVDEF